MRAIAQDPLQAEQVGDRGAVHRVRSAPGLAAHRRRQRRAVPGLPRGGAPSARPRPQTLQRFHTLAVTTLHGEQHASPLHPTGLSCPGSRSAVHVARQAAQHAAHPHAQTNSFEMLPLPLGPPAIGLHSKACPASARVGACIGFPSSTSPGLDPRPALLHTPYHRTRRCSTAKELPQRRAPGGAGRPRGPAGAPRRRRPGCCRR